jgi:CopG family nickel-responsive transcriptional regulator
MGELARIGVAIDDELLKRFDEYNTRRGYTNRSEAFRDLIRDALIQETAAADKSVVVGTLTLVYDHHVPMLQERLTEMQHEHHGEIISTLHVHLDHHHCLEVLVLRGRSGRIRGIADRLMATKGVEHGRLTLTAAG